MVNRIIKIVFVTLVCVVIVQPTYSSTELDHDTTTKTALQKCKTEECEKGECKILDSKENCICPENFLKFENICKKICDVNKCEKGECKIPDTEAKCTCPDNFLKVKNTCKKICETSTCDRSECKITDTEEKCTCPENYLKVGNACKKICQINACHKGKCEITDIEERCTCPENFLKVRSTCIKICRTDICAKGDCVVWPDEENCKCPQNYTKIGNRCKRICGTKICEKGECKIEDYEENCICPENYLKVGKTCKKICQTNACDKGECEIIDSEEKCTCPQNFLKVGNACRKICQTNACDKGECEITDSEENCTCPETFLKVGNICKRVMCNTGDCESDECDIRNKNDSCKCKEGYIRDGDKCKKDKCNSECGENEGVICIKKPTGHVDCGCKNKEKEFDWRDKNCKVNHCKEKCGTDESVICNGDTYRDDVKCICQDPSHIFKKDEKKCSDPCIPNPCKNNGNCSVEEGIRKCGCDSFYTGMDCEIEIDKCVLKYLKNECNKLHETCTKTGQCDCEVNYIYSEDKSRCLENFCKNTRCPRNSDCKELGEGNVQCICKKGYFRKEGMCVKKKICQGVSKCEHKCTSVKNAEICVCFPGFELDKSDNGSCIRVGAEPECAADCGEGVCVKEKNKTECKCPTAGYDSVNKTCIDKCTNNKGVAPSNMCPKDKCEPDSEYGFRCKCEDPYELSDDGVYCQRKIMCKEEKSLEECRNKRARCVEDLGDDTKGYKCECEDGYEEQNGICTEKCEMRKYINECSKLNAVCTMKENYNVECECSPLLHRTDKNSSCNLIAKYSYLGKLNILRNKYELSQNGRRNKSANIIDMRKLSKDIKDSMKTLYDNYNSLKVIGCSESDSKDLIYCSIELQFKDRKRDMSKISHESYCLPIDDDYCWVQPSLVLKKDAKNLFTVTDACDEEVSWKLCGNDTSCTSDVNKDFQCQCKEGFKVIGSYRPLQRENTYIEKCKDIDECQNSLACPETTFCSNTPGSYNCLCKDGYKRKGPHSDPKVDGCAALCDPNPCHNDAECIIVGNHSYSCKCKDSYVGIFCNETITIEKEKRDIKIFVIVGGVLGTLVIILLITVFVLCNKMKKYKDQIESDKSRRVESQIKELGHRQQHNFDRDIELSNNGRRPVRRDSGEYRRHYSDERIPRVQVAKNTDSFSQKRVASETEGPEDL